MKTGISRFYFWTLVALLLFTMLSAGACKGSTPTNTTTTTTTKTTTSSTTALPPPSVTITEPSGTQYSTGNVVVSVSVTNFTLVDKLGQSNIPGEGHIHYFLDVDPPTTAGQPAVTAAGTYAATTDTSYTWTNVTSGSHKLSVELVNNDHTPLVPPVTATKQLLIVPEIGPPNIVIQSPLNGADVPVGNLVVMVQVTNFNLIDKLGLANVEREGHIHYFLDVDAPTTQGQAAITAAGTYAATADTSYTWTNVAPGSHKLSVELVNNDHTPLNPPVVSTITVNVQAATITTTVTTTTTTQPTGQSVTIDLSAQNFAFDKSTITVPAGADVTLIFDNKDTGIPHNFALYSDSSLTTSIFIGQIITGRNTITYQFTAPANPGTYFFRCDLHPNMKGSFIVQ